MNTRDLPKTIAKYAKNIEMYEYNRIDEQHEVWLQGLSVDPIAPTHFFSESTLRQVKEKISYCTPCACYECKELIGNA